MNQHKQIIMKLPTKLVTIGGSIGVILPPDLRNEFGIEEGTELTLSLEKGKHGIFLAIWKKKRG